MPASGLAPVLHGVRVLVVDDVADARDMLTVLLTLCGAEVVAADCVRSARVALAAQLPDVLVSDIGMPDEDGYDLIRTLRARGPEQGGLLPAIAVTGFATEQDRARALAAGFQAHLAKPVDFATLVDQITRLTAP
jgi:CheY-like chemotaxis protein